MEKTSKEKLRNDYIKEIISIATIEIRYQTKDREGLYMYDEGQKMHKYKG